MADKQANTIVENFTAQTFTSLSAGSVLLMHFKPGAQAFGWRTPGFLKLILYK